MKEDHFQQLIPEYFSDEVATQDTLLLSEIYESTNLCIFHALEVEMLILFFGRSDTRDGALSQKAEITNRCLPRNSGLAIVNLNHKTPSSDNFHYAKVAQCLWVGNCALAADNYRKLPLLVLG